MTQLATAIRSATVDDAAAVCAIYNPFVRDSIVTFEEVPVAEADMARRIATVLEAFPWLVWDDGGGVAGYAYASPWLSRSAYRYSVETTVYVASDRQRQGIGTGLYESLIPALRDRGLHAAVGGIALPNPESIALHEKLGFRRVARFEQIGFKQGRWIDVGYWELLL